MIGQNRMLSALLATSMLLSGTPAAGAVSVHVESPPVPLAAAEDSDVTGKIEATLRLDFPQEKKALQDRNVTATLTGDSLKKTVELGEMDRRSIENDVQVIDLTFDDLPQGNYNLTFEGRGYKEFAKNITIGDYSQHLTLGTGDSSFTLGNLDDTNHDNAVDSKDVKMISDVLLKDKLTDDDKETFDLNGDGEVDVTDLAIVNHSKELSQTSDASLINTERLTPPGGEVKSLDGTTITVEGHEGESAVDVLMDQSITKTLTRTDETQRITEDTPVTAEVEFDSGEGIEMSQFKLLTKADDGEIRDGIITVTYDDDGEEKELKVPFKNQIPEDIHLLDENGDGVRTITINLGKRVPVKKITITVTKTEGGEFATVAAISFLEDIVPENPVPPNTRVCNLSADPGNEQVSLKWAALPNITGYEVVYYKTTGGDESDNQPIYTTTTICTVSGLDNGDEYTFKVTPVSQNDKKEVVWRGDTVECAATPETTKIPGKVNMVNVKAGDGKLDVSWKEGKEAETYTVTYSTSQEMTDKQVISGIVGTSTAITGLTNDITYYLYVEAVNRLGTGPASNQVSGTPKAVSYEVELPTKALLDRSKIQSFRLLEPGNVASGYNPPFNISYIMDDDYRTHWTASKWYGNEHVEVTFTEPVGLSAALWVPRLDGQYPDWLRCYSIRVWTDAAHGGLNGKLIVPDEDHGGRDDGATGNSSAMQTWPNVRNNPSQTHVAILPFGPLEGITKIQVAVEQIGYNLVSLSELKFVEYDPENDIPTKIDALFADTLHTQLASGVTAEQIAELGTLLEANKDFCLYPDTLKDELALAKELLDSGTSSGVVLRGLNRVAEGASILQPLGVSANAGSTITVYADIPEGEKVELFATQANAEASAWKASIGTVTTGCNTITIPKIGSQASNNGGSLYFTYTGNNGSQVGLHIRRATDIPALDLANWYELDEDARRAKIQSYLDEVTAYRGTLSATGAENPKNVTEISVPSVLLSLPVTAVPTGATVQSIENTILAWEQIMQICRTTQGIDTENGQNRFAVRQNVRCMQMFEGAFMYAAGSHIGIGAGSCRGMLTGSPVTESFSGAANSLFGWGIAHEIGHNMDKLGKAEITNNIYSIMVQTYDGKSNTLTSRLESSGKYTKIFDKVAQARPGASNDVFVQLGMYWQLHLAYDGKDQPMDFYHRFFKAWNAGDWGTASTYDEKVAVVASKTANANLTEFFERWGMSLSDSVKSTLNALPAEPRAIWYLNDQSRRERLANEANASGSISVTAEVKNDKDVVLTITPTITGKVQGYEIRRGGSSIGFVIADGSNEVTFTDHVGSANHMTYTYTVTAYDSLGNRFAESTPTVPPEIRIAYDLTVDPGSYTIARAEDTGNITVTFKETTAVSGLKLVGTAENPIPGSGAYTVSATVKVNDQNSTVTARSGDFGQSNLAADTRSYLTYFNKPGTDSTDTRIWTYDVTSLEITGIPTGFPLDSVQFISYAGDDVAFYPGAAVGVLANDYGEIKAGTLVIVGTYRGGPVYSLLKVEGEFTKTYTDAKTDGEPEEKIETETRFLNGDMYLFAEVHADKDVSSISDGLFIFVPDFQKEAALQVEKGEETVSNCSGVNLLPSRMRIVMTNSTTPDEVTDERVTAQTLWIETPGGDELPRIILQ